MQFVSKNFEHEWLSALQWSYNNGKKSLWNQSRKISKANAGFKTKIQMKA